MKSLKDLKTKEHTLDPDEMRKPAKLAPARKNGKERHALYGADEEDDLDFEADFHPTRESILDYFDTDD